MDRAMLRLTHLAEQSAEDLKRIVDDPRVMARIVERIESLEESEDAIDAAVALAARVAFVDALKGGESC